MIVVIALQMADNHTGLINPHICTVDICEYPPKNLARDWKILSTAAKGKQVRKGKRQSPTKTEPI